MKIHIIISNDAAWKVNWKKIQLPTDEYCLLIADKISCHKIQSCTQNHFFKRIIECTDFTFDHLREKFAGIKDEFPEAEFKTCYKEQIDLV